MLAVLWAIGTIWLGALIVQESMQRQRFQYLYKMRDNAPKPWEQDWKKPLYEIVKSPAKQSLPVSFAVLEYQYWDAWDKDVVAGAMTAPKFPDGSALYMSASLTKEDQDYIARGFWDQRWDRRWLLIWPWIIGLVAPPIVLFIFGWALLWVGRGFRSA